MERKKISKETRKKMSESHKGHYVSIETRKKISETQKGKHNSPNSEFKKGHKTWNKGKPHLKIREENHYKWKGGGN